MAEKPTNVIKWENMGESDIVWEYPDDRIRVNTVLVVNDWQWAVFMRDGQILSVMDGGKHLLTTANFPFITKFIERIQGFREGVFKAKVIFISKKQFVGKWGTRTMVKVAEDYQAPIPLLTNGDYVYRVSDPTLFITQMVAGAKGFTTGNVTAFIRSFLNEQLTQQLAKQYYMDVFTGLEKASLTSKVAVEPEFVNRGLELLALKIMGVDTEEKYQEDIYKFQQFGSSGGERWKQYGVMETMAGAIGEGGGGAAIGTGMLLFPQMYQQLSQQQQQQAMTKMQESGASEKNPKILCPYCGGVNDYPYKFCKECGKPAPEPQQEEARAVAAATPAPAKSGGGKKYNNCPYCGEDISALPKTPKFCPFCAEQLN